MHGATWLLLNSSGYTICYRVNFSRIFQPRFQIIPGSSVHSEIFAVYFLQGNPRISSLAVAFALPSFAHIPTVPVAGVEKEERASIGPWGYLNRQFPLIELP